MKKIIILSCIILLVTTGFIGCKGEEQSKKEYKIVCTTFSQYDWVREIVGDDIDNVDIEILLDNGVDLHSYQPTTEDVAKIASCDMFIYVGGESDEWVEQVLKENKNENRTDINLMEVLGDERKEEETVEGMEENHEEHDGHEEHEEIEYDEHIWLSLKNAQRLIPYIADKLGNMDKNHKNEYHTNQLSYSEKIKSLDKEYQKAMEKAKKKELIFGDRFPFRYLVDDYGLTYYAAFSGCSAESEASFETIVFLADKVDEGDASAVLTLEGSDKSIAETIISNTEKKNQAILSLNSIQSVTHKDIEAGDTYLGIMEENLKVIKEAVQ